MCNKLPLLQCVGKALCDTWSNTTDYARKVDKFDKSVLFVSIGLLIKQLNSEQKYTTQTVVQ